MTNSLDPDQARQNVGPDLGPNCLQKLSSDDTSRKRVNFSEVLGSKLMSQTFKKNRLLS